METDQLFRIEYLFILVVFYLKLPRLLPLMRITMPGSEKYFRVLVTIVAYLIYAANFESNRRAMRKCQP